MKPNAVRLRPEEIHFDFIRSPGPGGQNANKVATAVQLRFDARNSKSIGSMVRERLYRLAGKRVNSAGEIIIEAKRFRTQRQNRRDAMHRLFQLIDKARIDPKVRRKSHPTAASVHERLQSKKKRSDVKKLRAKAGVEGADC